MMLIRNTVGRIKDLKNQIMDSLYAILGLSFILLVLVGTLYIKHEKEGDRPVKVEKIFYNYNF